MLKDNFQEKKRDVQKIEINQRKIMGNLYRLNMKIKKMATKRSRLSDRMIAVKGNVRGLARSINDMEERILDQRKQLSKRMRRIYKSGAYSLLQSIFSATSAADLDRNLEFMRRVSMRDYELIKGYESSLRGLEDKRRKLRTEVRSLVKVKGKLKLQESNLEKTQKSKNSILAQLRVRKRNNIDQIKSMREKSLKYGLYKRGFDLNQESFRESIFERKGNLVPPVLGTPEKDFGLLLHPKYRYRLSHKGYFYGTAVGTNVNSIFRGKVEFVGKVVGYGNTVIIGHGDHYYSLYSQLNIVRVKLNEKINEGQSVGTAGLGRREMGAGVYFELRHFSEPVDPAKWFKDKSVRQQARSEGGKDG